MKFLNKNIFYFSRITHNAAIYTKEIRWALRESRTGSLMRVRAVFRFRPRVDEDYVNRQYNFCNVSMIVFVALFKPRLISLA